MKTYTATEKKLVECALACYVCEPCRICGKAITWNDLQEDKVVWAGYSSYGSARTAHQACWNQYHQQPQKWKHR